MASLVGPIGLLMTDHSTVAIYTTHEQTEQPVIAHYVTALSVAGGLLTIECDVAENGCTFSAYHRFEPGHWAHFEVTAP